MEKKIAAEIENIEHRLQQQNERKRLVHGETCRQTAVVKVTFVRMKDALSAKQAAEGNAGEIEAGNDQQRVGHEKTVRAEGENVGVVHGVFDGQISQSVAQHKTPGVAHEGLGAFAFGTKHVEEKEREHTPHKSDGQQGVGDDVELPKEQGESGESDHRKSGGQTVDAVDEIDGIDNEQADEHGEGIAHPKRNFVDAAKTVEVVDVKTAEGHEKGGGQLYGEFERGFEAENVVENANEIDHEQPDDEQHRGKSKHGEFFLRFVGRQQCIGGSHAQPHARGKEKTAEARDLVVVYFALVGHVVETAASTEVEQTRHEKMRSEKAHGESKKEQYELKRQGHGR